MYHVVMGIAPEDEQALTKADVVASLPDAAESVSVTIVHVTDEETDLRSVPAVREAHEYLDERGVDVSLHAGDGTPLNAVLDTAKTENADLICIGGRRRSPAGKMQMRSGSEAIILNTDRPVLVAGESTDTS